MGNYLYVKALDLTKKFDDIEKQLFDIALLVNNNIKEELLSWLFFW